MAAMNWPVMSVLVPNPRLLLGTEPRPLPHRPAISGLKKNNLCRYFEIKEKLM